jgi:hypothetical protein
VEVNIEGLQARAARHPSRHVNRFEPLIPIVIDALQSAGIKVERYYTNQVKIADRWMGRFDHVNRTADHISRLAIYAVGRVDHDTEPVLEIRNEAEARLFAKTVALVKDALGTADAPWTISLSKLE